MSKKGFTLIELLVVILIIALLGGVGVISFTSIFGTSAERYYESIESSIVLAGNDYYLDHREELPIANHVNNVSIATLVDGKYIEPIKKSNGETCTEGKVYVYKDENNKYRYETCIECDGSYTSKGKYCQGATENEIVLSGKKKTSGSSYNVSLSYDNAPYSKENIEVTVSMRNVSTVISEYEVKNTKTGVAVPCQMSGYTCKANIGSSGTYQVKAKVAGKEIASKYFNVKITHDGPNFTLTHDTITPLACTNNDTQRNVTIKILKDNINEEYQSISYTIKKKVFNTTTNQQEATQVASGNQNNITRGENGKEYYINATLPSGRYELSVTITNFAGEPTEETLAFDVTYYASVEFDDNDYAGLSNKHEVVYGQKYNYKSTLPTKKKAYNINNMNIRWHKNNVLIDGDTKVTDTCTHTIVGKMSVPVTRESNYATYCKSVTYNGNSQNLTNDPPTNVTFINRSQKNVNTETLYAHIETPQYIWSDGTTEDIPFNCSMTPKTVTVTAANKSMTYGGSAPSYSNTVSGAVNNETAVTGTATYTIKSGNTTISNVSVAAAGSYTIVPGGLKASANYSISYSNGTLTINKKALTCPNTTIPEYEYSGSSINSDISCPTGSSAGGQTSGTNEGTYTQTCTADSNHSFSSECKPQWKIVKTKYTVKYNANGGTLTGGNTVCTYGSNCTLNTASASRADYTFLGWSTTSNTQLVLEDENTYSKQVGSSESYAEIKLFENVATPASGEKYSMQVEIKGEGTLVNYFWRSNSNDKLQTSSTFNTKGSTFERIDGGNFADFSSSWVAYSVEYRFPTSSLTTEKKHMWFLVQPNSSSSSTPKGYIKNIRVFKGGLTIAEGGTVKNLSAAGTQITLYAVWGGTGSATNCSYRIYRRSCAGGYEGSEGYSGPYDNQNACNNAISSYGLCGSMCSCSCIHWCR